MVRRQAVPLQPREGNGGAEIALQPAEDPKGRDSVVKPALEQFVEDCSAWKGLELEKLMEGWPLWEGPHAGAGEECEESSP